MKPFYHFFQLLLIIWGGNAIAQSGGDENSEDPRRKGAFTSQAKNIEQRLKKRNLSSFLHTAIRDAETDATLLTISLQKVVEEFSKEQHLKLFDEIIEDFRGDYSLTRVDVASRIIYIKFLILKNQFSTSKNNEGINRFVLELTSILSSSMYNFEYRGELSYRILQLVLVTAGDLSMEAQNAIKKFSQVCRLTEQVNQQKLKEKKGELAKDTEDKVLQKEVNEAAEAKIGYGKLAKILGAAERLFVFSGKDFSSSQMENLLNDFIHEWTPRAMQGKRVGWSELGKLVELYQATDQTDGKYKIFGEILAAMEMAAEADALWDGKLLSQESVFSRANEITKRRNHLRKLELPVEGGERIRAQDFFLLAYDNFLASAEYKNRELRPKVGSRAKAFLLDAPIVTRDSNSKEVSQKFNISHLADLVKKGSNLVSIHGLKAARKLPKIGIKW